MVETDKAQPSAGRRTSVYTQRPIIDLGQGAQEILLPGRETPLDPASMLEARATVVFGERKAGFGAFTRWWTEQARAREPKHEVVIVSGWDPANIQGEGEIVDDAEIRSALTIILRAPQADDALTRLVDLSKRMTRGGQRDVHLFVRHLGGMERAKAQKLSSLLRTLYEGRQAYHQERLRTIINTSSAELIADTRAYSGLLTVSHRYRLAPFGRDDIRLVAGSPTHPQEEPLSFSEEELVEIRAFTGGQPILVNGYLQRLREAKQLGKDPAEHRSYAEDALRRSPPEIVSTWKEQLVDLLQQHRDLEEPLSYYVRDQWLSPTMKNRYPPPDQERELFISGWVGLDRHKRWGIRSPLHRDWARAALDQVRKTR